MFEAWLVDSKKASFNQIQIYRFSNGFPLVFHGPTYYFYQNPTDPSRSPLLAQSPHPASVAVRSSGFSIHEKKKCQFTLGRKNKHLKEFLPEKVSRTECRNLELWWVVDMWRTQDTTLHGDKRTMPNNIPDLTEPIINNVWTTSCKKKND